MEFDTFDAFDAGIALGGLRNRNEIRLLICYLLKAIDKPIATSVLLDALLDEGLANYFEVGEAISELLKSGSIQKTTDEETDEELLLATEEGKNSAELLEATLPKTVREKAVNSAIKLMTLARNKRENKILQEALPNGGYNVTFVLGDGQDELMRLTVFVADSMQLEMVKNNFLKDPVKLYSSILTALTI